MEILELRGGNNTVDVQIEGSDRNTYVFATVMSQSEEYANSQARRDMQMKCFTL
jgi:hypothetical protein